MLKSQEKQYSYFHKHANNQSLYNILDKFAHTIIASIVIIMTLSLVNWASILTPVYAAQSVNQSEISSSKYNFHVNQPSNEYFNTMEEVHERDIQRLLAQGNIVYMTVTAYNSEVAQCDSTPCITADGFNVCEHNQEDVIATNILPFGTKVMFPELFGDRVFTVHDRMNAKYSYRADIWMKNHSDAIQFGANYNIKMVVLK